jgi:hypothetical protein
MQADDAPREYRSLTDADLLRLLETEDDRLPREAVDEFVRRGDRMIEPLTAICRDERRWKSPEDGSWVPVHATFILGAIGGEDVLPGLLDALVHAAQHEYATVTDDLPDIFARLGPAALPGLRRLLSDTALPATVRTEVPGPMAAIAAGLDVAARDDLLDVLRGVASRDPDWAVRGSAGSALLDFARPDDRDFLLRLGRRLEEKTEIPHFVAEDVTMVYESPGWNGPRLGDWLHFYDATAIAARQRERQDELEDERWAEGLSNGADWVQKEIDSINDAFVASLTDADEDAQGIARRAAGSMMRYLVEDHEIAPWRWDAALLDEYLMGHFASSVMMMDIEVRQVPGLVARFVKRRLWHPTQQIRRVGGGIELTMDVAGTTELVSWVLGFGDKAEVLEPESLREEVGAELARAAARYGRHR